MQLVADRGAPLEREQWAARYDTVRAYTETLAAPLSAEDQTVQSMPDVSPTKWHRAHITWFFENFLLAPYLAGLSRLRSGVRLSVQFLLRGGRAASSASGARPAVAPGIEEIARYRAHVDAAMRRLILTATRRRGASWRRWSNSA